MTGIIETLLTVITALGGFEAIKYFLNRKTNKRKAEAEADSAEFNALREYNEFLQRQLSDKEERFTNQTDRLRTIQDEYFDLMKKNAQTELELQKFRCIRAKCPNREPQNGY
ncbi:MAG: hypothetical protein PUF62_01560 [Bacteroidales bacterium]|nr:hypothetical protein [Bacteroidales bacterium]